MSDLMIEYCETICQNWLGYTEGSADYQNYIFYLIQDCLMVNGKVTLTAGSTVTGKETTYTLTADSEMIVTA